jgi:hypothetical protein
VASDGHGCVGFLLACLAAIVCGYGIIAMVSYFAAADNAVSACPRSGVAYRTLDFTPIWPRFSLTVHCLGGKTVHVTDEEEN